MTTNYTPTTEVVWEWIEQDTLPGMRKEVRAQFDRWLGEHDAGVLEGFVDSLHIGSRPTPTGPEALDAIRALAHSRAAKLRSES